MKSSSDHTATCLPAHIRQGLTSNWIACRDYANITATRGIRPRFCCQKHICLISPGEYSLSCQKHGSKDCERQTRILVCLCSLPWILLFLLLNSWLLCRRVLHTLWTWIFSSALWMNLIFCTKQWTVNTEPVPRVWLWCISLRIWWVKEAEKSRMVGKAILQHVFYCKGTTGQHGFWGKRIKLLQQSWGKTLSMGEDNSPRQPG